MNSSNAIAGLVSCAVLGWVAINASPTQAAILEWSLTFENGSGVQIGSGGFSYDTDQVVVVRSQGKRKKKKARMCYGRK